MKPNILVARLAADNLIAALDGKRPPNLLSPVTWRG